MQLWLCTQKRPSGVTITLSLFFRFYDGGDGAQKRNQNQKDDAAVNREGNNLRAAEEFVFRPNVANFYWCAGDLQRRQLGRRDEVPKILEKRLVERLIFDFNAGRICAAQRTHCAASCFRARAEPFFEIVREAVLKFYRSEGVILRAFADFDGPLGEEILQVGKEVLVHRMLLIFQTRSELTGRKIHGLRFRSVWVWLWRKFKHSYVQVPDGRIRYSVRYKPRGIVVLVPLRPL